MTSCRTWEAKRRPARPRRVWRRVAVALALVAAGLWATRAGTSIGVWAIAISGTMALVALAVRLTPRWGRPAACRLRGAVLSFGLVLVAAAPANEQDLIGALLQGFGGMVAVAQVFAGLTAGYIAMRLLWRTYREEQAGRGQAC